MPKFPTGALVRLQVLGGCWPSHRSKGRNGAVDADLVWRWPSDQHILVRALCQVSPASLGMQVQQGIVCNPPVPAAST